MEPNQDKAMEQLVMHVMRTGSKTCPKCTRETLVSDFDEHYWKLHCTSCGFRHEDYMSGA